MERPDPIEEIYYRGDPYIDVRIDRYDPLLHLEGDLGLPGVWDQLLRFLRNRSFKVRETLEYIVYVLGKFRRAHLELHMLMSKPQNLPATVSLKFYTVHIFANQQDRQDIQAQECHSLTGSVLLPDGNRAIRERTYLPDYSWFRTHIPMPRNEWPYGFHDFAQTPTAPVSTPGLSTGDAPEQTNTYTDDIGVQPYGSTTTNYNEGGVQNEENNDVVDAIAYGAAANSMPIGSQ